MSHSDQVPSFYSYKTTEMEGLNSLGNGGEEVVTDNGPPPNQFMYLQVRTDGGLPLAPTLFTKEVIAGMVEMQGKSVVHQDEPPLGVHLLSDIEAVVEYSGRVNLQRMITWMSPLQFWLGKKVQVVCRPASPEEVEQAKRHDEEEEREPHHDTQEERIIRMMEDIHRLATNPGGEALRIQTFSGTVPPPKNETTFAQWIHDVREAQARFPESTVRNWISRSLRGPPADAVRSLGPYVGILPELHTRILVTRYSSV